MDERSTICAKCDGQGSITGFEHVQQGVCFSCGGTGQVVLSARAALRGAAQQHKTARVNALDAADHDLNVAWGRTGIHSPARFEEAKAALFAAPTDQEAVDAVREILY